MSTKIGILGSTDVAKALANSFLSEGHPVKMGSREPGKLSAWVKEYGNDASPGTFADAAKFGDLAVVVVRGTALDSAIQMAGPENFKGKLISFSRNE